MIILKRYVVLAIIFASLAVVKDSHAQTSGDSTAAQIRYQQELKKRDSILAAAKEARRLDSLNRVIQKQKAQAYRDSLREAMAEKRRQDSIQREELKAQMLAERIRQDSIRQAQREEMQRLIAERKRQADSIRMVRKARADSISAARAEAKRIRDALRKYKNSKHYKDSVARARQFRRDSIKQARDERLAIIKKERAARLDSIKQARAAEIAAIKAERKRVMDSTIAARKSFNDSVRAARKQIAQELKLARQKRKDSLEAVRSKDKIVKKKKKTEQELLKEEADKIHARKRGSWTNEELLKKPWNIKRRIWQNTVTRYNAYYNAKRKFDEAMVRFKDRHKESLTEQISIRPYDLESGLSAIGGDMDSVVKKCAYDAHIHDPRSKWFDNLYHLMGRAFYFKNDYESAITAFQYVVNEYRNGDKKKRQKKGYKKIPALDEIKFDKKNKITLATLEERGGLKTLAHHPVRNESLVWLARAYTKNKQFGEAQSILNILEEDKQFPDRLNDELYMALAELHMEQGNDIAAIEPLERAVKQAGISKEMRNRINYLLAQLYAKDGNLAASNKYLKQALKSKLPLEMEYFSKLALAQNAIKGKGSTKDAILQLESLAKNEKFEKWRAQTYLSLGQILQKEQPEKAITFYKKSLSQEDNKALKAAAFLGMGEIHFDKAEYRKAKVAYDSTLSFSKDANPALENMANINLRKDVLGSLVKFTTIIETEDSLQTLSKKSRKEQIATIKKELRRQQKERRKKLQEESAKLTAVTLTPGKFGKNDWYFYNNTAVQTGILEFKTKWGERKLSDNWRRSAVNGASGGSIAFDDGDSTNSSNNEEDLTRNAEVKKLLDVLYSTPTEYEESDKKIKDAYFQLALIYSSRLQEYKRSIQTLTALNNRYSKHDQLAASYYSMFLSHNKLNEKSRAKIYEEKLLNEFPKTEFAKLVGGNLNQNNKEEKEVIALYDSAYQMLERAEYQNALSNATASLNQFPDNLLKPKFELVKARSLAGLRKYDSSMTVTENIIKSFPGTAEEKYAQDFLGYLVKATQLSQGVLANINKNDSSTKKLALNNSAIYTYNKYEKHYLIVYLTSIDGKTLQLKAGFSDYNRLKHAQKKLKTNMNLINRKTGVISIVGFKDAQAAKKFEGQVLKEPNLLTPIAMSNFKTMIISESNFKELLKTRKMAEYIKFYDQRYKK